MKKLCFVMSAALVVALLPALAVAGSSSDAMAWIDKMIERKATSFTADYKFDGNLSQMGQQVKLSMTGKVMQKDSTHLRMEVDAAMTMQGMDQPMNLEMLNVKDGNTLWVQINNPMMGKQVMKLELAKMESMDSANPMLKNLETADVIGQLKALVDSGSFTVASESADSVTLEGEITAPMVERFGAKLDDLPEGDRTVTLVIDKKTAFPAELRLGGADPFVRFVFENFKVTDDFAEGTFSYTPPEGVNVMDLATMGGMGG